MNGKHIITVLFLLFSLSFSTLSKSEPLPMGMDGEFWIGVGRCPIKEARRTFRLGIIRGIVDGLVVGESSLIDNDKLLVFTSYDHLEIALDQFYSSDYRNRKILIVLALEVIAMELRGKSKEEIDRKLRLLRQTAPWPPHLSDPNQ